MDIPLYPPASWFEHPGDIPTDRRVTVTASGQVFGYVALWDQCHMTMGRCVKPPKGSPTNYQLALTGETQTAEGAVVATANIGGGAGHASPEDDPHVASDFYANTSTQMMRVVYGEDDNGIWFAGALWPDVSELDIAHIRASAISGDWRPVGLWRRGQSAYDFVGSCFVNVGGYATDVEGSITSEPGVPMQIAAAAGAQPGDIVLIDSAYALAMTDQTNTPSKSDCDGSCSECTCGDPKATQASAVSPATEQMAELGMKVDNLTNLVSSLVEAQLVREASDMLAEDESE